MGDKDTDTDIAIKTMKLYSNVHRIYSELKELGYSRDDPLKVEEVCRFDQYHYHGINAVDEAVEMFQITSSSRVLDIGSGLGGPARYMASRTHCHITALELQQDLNETSRDLTRRCGLADVVHCVYGDFLSMDLGRLGRPYDLITSWLVFLHIPNKTELFDKCNKVLKSGGNMYIEDIFIKHPLTDSEKWNLKTGVYSEGLQTREEYVGQLQAAGFATEFVDSTASFTHFVRERLQHHHADEKRYTRVHGSQVYKEQREFFSIMCELFSGGNLGGCKITASKIHNG